jgi:hypothetical protein
MMAALRPIQRDPLLGIGESLEDKYRRRQREAPRSIEQLPLQSNAFSVPMAGFKTSGHGGGRSLRGGTFAPRAVSGML